MKTVLAAVNAKFIHSNLAVRYLKAAVVQEFPDTEFVEFNINQTGQWIVREIVRRQPEVLGVSCYIWNWSLVQNVISDVRRILPKIVIVLGGPEVSYDCEEHMNRLPEVDFIVRGEGEKPLLELLRGLSSTVGRAQWQQAIPGLVYRSPKGVFQPEPYAANLADLVSPYAAENQSLDNKVVYYEASRGCPYRCSFCLSSLSGPVRHFPLQQVKNDLGTLVEQKPEQIRFVDRTFNADPNRALALVEWMAGLETDTRFHLEITGDGLGEELLAAFEQAPQGRFQLEIGVQSSSAKALQGVQRRSDLDSLAQKVRRLRQDPRPTRIMLDLIAGLPYEDWNSIVQSFNFVYSLRPMKIHLGFLKFLRGSELRRRADELGYVFQKQAPYEVLRSEWLTWEEFDRLHVMEDLVEKYYNSGRFSLTLRRGIPQLRENPFEVFDQWAKWWTQNSLDARDHGVTDLYRYLFLMSGSSDPFLLSCLGVDYRRHHRTQVLPAEWKLESANQQLQHWLATDQPYHLFPELARLSRRQIQKRMHTVVLPNTLWNVDGIEVSGQKASQVLFFFYPELRTPAEVLVYAPGRNSVVNPRISKE